MEVLAPNVVAIPWMWVDPKLLQFQKPEVLYNALLEVAREYVRQMKG